MVLDQYLQVNLQSFFKRIDFIHEASYDDLIKVDRIGTKLAETIIENNNLSKSKDIYYRFQKNKIEI